MNFTISLNSKNYEISGTLQATRTFQKKLQF